MSNLKQVLRWETVVHLRFLGKDSTPNNSPTLYAADTDWYVIQGWIVTDDGIVSTLTIADDETIVEVPARLLDYLSLDDMDTDRRNLVPPIVHVKENGNYIILGKRVTDAKVLGQMNIPDYETCVLVSKSAVAQLVGG